MNCHSALFYHELVRHNQQGVGGRGGRRKGSGDVAGPGKGEAHVHREEVAEAGNEVGEGSAVVEGETSGCVEAREVDGDGYVVDVAANCVISV